MQSHAITAEEWNELAAVPEVKEGWGLEGKEDDGVILSSMVYGSRYDFVSGGPGYCGDVFVLMGDSLQPPMVLTREEGKLVARFNTATS